MLQIYNTITQTKSPFKPLKEGKISLYTCGVTVYDYCHLGHARVFVAFDVIVRFLRESGWQVKYVRNITDIDDKIIKRAKENNESISSLTERFIKAMTADAKALNVLAPDAEPRATHHIQQIIDMINKLLQKGFAYVAENGDVYFQVERFNHYGALSGKDLNQLQAGARVAVSAQKRSDFDFVLWKKAKTDEPHWPSPWGPGRPGWHIECSAMSTNLLGDTFDIHGGGFDLIFPHHENERAQSECATGHTFANVWMHVGFVQVDKEKMSKSLNNFFTIREVLTQYDPEVIRYCLIASHYRSPLNYSEQQLEQAKQALTTLYSALRGLELKAPEKALAFKEHFFKAMNDDFNTPVALSVLFDIVRVIHHPQTTKPEQETLAYTLKSLGNVLGLLARQPNDFLHGKIDPTFIQALITEREHARKKKDWQKADILRKKLEDKGVLLEDTAEGTLWRQS